MHKISIIGAGMTGATTALWLAERELADLVLVDVVEGMPQGKGLDMLEAMPIIGRDVEIVGSNDYAATKGSDIIIITAGLPRKPGMSRDDLLSANAEIVGKAATETLKYSPDAIYIVLTNPLDTMAYLTLKLNKLPRERVIGQAGVLDSARMRAFVAQETGVSVENIQCYVLGGHGDEMVPLTRHSNVAGIPLREYLSPEKLDAIVSPHPQGRRRDRQFAQERLRVLCSLGGGGADERGHPQGQAPDPALLGLYAGRIWPARHILRRAGHAWKQRAWKRSSNTSLMPTRRSSLINRQRL